MLKLSIAATKWFNRPRACALLHLQSSVGHERVRRVTQCSNQSLLRGKRQDSVVCLCTLQHIPAPRVECRDCGVCRIRLLGLQYLQVFFTREILKSWFSGIFIERFGTAAEISTVICSAPINGIASRQVSSVNSDVCRYGTPRHVSHRPSWTK